MSDFVSKTELITQDYLSYKLQKSGYHFESFSKWPTVYCQTCKSKLEIDVITHCYTCDDAKMNSVPEEKSDEAPCQGELKLMREMCDLLKGDFEKGLGIDTASINPNKATVQITLLQEADNLFKNETNWKGIVSLLILSGVLATSCAEKGYISEVKSIERNTSWYINEKLGPWIKETGGWESFSKWAEYTSENYPEVKIWAYSLKAHCMVIVSVPQKSLIRQTPRIQLLDTGMLQALVRNRPRIQQMDSVPLQYMLRKRTRSQQKTSVSLISFVRNRHRIQQTTSVSPKTLVRNRPRVQQTTPVSPKSLVRKRPRVQQTTLVSPKSLVRKRPRVQQMD